MMTIMAVVVVVVVAVSSPLISAIANQPRHAPVPEVGSNHAIGFRDKVPQVKTRLQREMGSTFLTLCRED